MRLRAEAWPIVLTLLGLPIGCAQQQPATTLAQIEVALTAAEKAAAIYVRLPQCIVSNQPMCSQKSVVDQIKLNDQAAYDAFMAARAAPADSVKQQIAAAAIASLVALIPVQPPPRAP